MILWGITLLQGFLPPCNNTARVCRSHHIRISVAIIVLPPGNTFIVCSCNHVQIKISIEIRCLNIYWLINTGLNIRLVGQCTGKKTYYVVFVLTNMVTV